MKYLILSNANAAQNRSRAIANAAGCGRKPEDVTRFWFSVIKHPQTKQGAMVIPDTAQEAKLNGSEKNNLKDQTTLDGLGWFPKQEAPGKTSGAKLGALAVESPPNRLTVELWRVKGQGVQWGYVAKYAGLISLEAALLAGLAWAKYIGLW